MAEMMFVRNQVVAQRREWLGEPYLVLPVVAIVAGVLNRELVTAEEIASGYQSWNGRPVTLDHPTDDGAFISANAPSILERCGVGQLFNTIFTRDRLKAEAWIKVSVAQKTRDGQELLERAEAEQPVEVSTAYYRRAEESPGELDGVPYDTIAYDLKPDHLAILLHNTGACSWQDGCGIRANALSKARTPTYSGTETTGWGDVGKSFGDYAAGYYKNTDASEPDEPITRIEDAPDGMRSWIASKTLLGDSRADNPRDLIFFPVVNPSTNKLNAGAVRAVLSGRGAQADIPDDALESARSVAQSLLEKEFGGGEDEGAANRIIRAAKRLGEMIVQGMVSGTLKVQEESLDERSARVRDAFYSRMQRPTMPEVDGGGEPWVREVFDDRIIVEQGGGLYAYPYTTTEDGYEFGDATPVSVEYVPRGDTPPKAQKEVSSMSNLVEQVAERYGIAADELADVPESVLTTLVEHQDPEHESQDGTPCDEFQALIEYAQQHGGPEQVVANLEAVDAAQAQATTERIDALVANEACAFTREQLEGLDDTQLGALEHTLRPADYSGVPNQETSQGEQVVELPPLGG